jgi:hypothetical protein
MKPKATLAVALFLLLSFIAGCSPAPVPPVAPPSASVLLSEPEAVTAAVRTAIHAFLSNDFAAAQKAMLFQPVEQKDAKTPHLFAEFSAHLNKRLALEAKSAGVNAAMPVVSITNIHQTENGGTLADVIIGAGPDLETFRLTVKVARRNGVWLLDHAFFMLALVDALDE